MEDIIAPLVFILIGIYLIFTKTKIPIQYGKGSSFYMRHKPLKTDEKTHFRIQKGMGIMFVLIGSLVLLIQV